MQLSQLGRLWRTVRHLRAEQWLGRLWIRAVKPRPGLSAAPPLRPPGSTAWALPAARSASLTGTQTFDFLGLQHTLPAGAAAWNDTQLSHLWRYNLHYFDDVNAVGGCMRRAAHLALVERWIAENPPGAGTGWEPYPTSLRIVNWVKWSLGGATLSQTAIYSLAVQARWLRRRLEWHLLGNHLFANAKALLAAGLYFDGPEAEGWLRCALRLLQREIPEQILADGGQFERSPMYHALAVEDLLDMLNLVRTLGAGTQAQALLPLLHERLPQMLYWLRCMVQDDGRLVHFNDSADGIAPATAEIERYAASLNVTAATPGDGVQALHPSGYVRAAWDDALLWADVAPLGPDYLVGHAHADTLSFELSLAGRSVVVNGGTSRYGLGPERLRERSTSAHSTVEVAGQDSSEVWSGFRVGRRARPINVRIYPHHISAAHDGYRWLPGAPLHHRAWTLQVGGLQVEDRVTPAMPAVARYHLAPGLELRRLDSPSRWAVMDGNRLLAQVDVSIGSSRAASSWHAPRFGSVLPTQALVIDLKDGIATTQWSWSPDAHPVSH